MDTSQYFKSLTEELKGLQNRVRNFIDCAHWQTDGEWKESVVRYFLRRNLPGSVQVGRGFVVTPNGASSQIDVLIYHTSAPVLFRDGDLVFVTPDSVVAVIEVKSRVDVTSLGSAIRKLGDKASFISRGTDQIFGLFSFESSVPTESALQILEEIAATNNHKIIDLLCLGDSHLIRWWYTDPLNHGQVIQRWHSYRLPYKAPGYFLHNIVYSTSPKSVSENQDLWFPKEGKEDQKDGARELKFLAGPR